MEDDIKQILKTLPDESLEKFAEVLDIVWRNKTLEESKKGLLIDDTIMIETTERFQKGLVHYVYVKLEKLLGKD